MKKKTFEPLRWTLARAANEFGLSPKTVSTRAKAAGLVPGADKKFSTQDVHAAICGQSRAELANERLKGVKLENERKRMELKEAAESLVSVDEMVRRLTPGLASMRQIILTSTLAEDERDNLIEALGDVLDGALAKPSDRFNEESEALDV